MIVLEAMAAGVPVVSTAVGGIPEMVTEREAWLVPAGDPAALAAALGKALGDPAESANRATAARGRLDRDFATRPWVDRHAELYRSLLERRHERPRRYLGAK